MDNQHIPKKSIFPLGLESHVITLYGELIGAHETNAKTNGADDKKKPVKGIVAKKQVRAKANELFTTLEHIFKQKKEASVGFVLELGEVLKKVAENKGHITERKNDPEVVQSFMENYGAFLLANKKTINEMQKKETTDIATDPQKESLTKKLIMGIAGFNTTNKARRGIVSFIVENHGIWYDPEQPETSVHDQIIHAALSLNTRKRRLHCEGKDISFVMNGKNLGIINAKDGDPYTCRSYTLDKDKNLSMVRI